MKVRLGYVMLIVKDIKKSARFYKKLLSQKPDFIGVRWGQFTLSNSILGLKTVELWSDPKDPMRKVGIGQKGASFILSVDNLETMVSHLKKEKISIVYGPRVSGLGKILYVLDPDKYFVQICEPLQK